MKFEQERPIYHATQIDVLITKYSPYTCSKTERLRWLTFLVPFSKGLNKLDFHRGGQGSWRLGSTEYVC